MRKVLLAACAVLAMTGVAYGIEIKPYTTVGAWEVDVVLNDACMATSAYPNNGTDLMFGINSDGIGTIGIYNTKWNIPAGDYPAKASIDGMATSAFTAKGDGNLVSWQFSLNEAMISKLSRGSIFKVALGTTEYSYNLVGTAAMFPTLIKCIGDVAKAANPFHGQSAPVEQPAEPVSTPSNPFRRT